MKKYLFLTALAFIMGALLTTTAAIYAVRQQPTKILSAIGANTPRKDTAVATPPTSRTPPKEQHQIDFQNSFGNIINDLESAQGYELDHYSYHNLIVINQNTIGMLREIHASVNDPGLKQLAAQMKELREAEVERLYTLQKAAGHTHH